MTSIIAIGASFFMWLSGGRILDGPIPKEESGYFSYDVCHQNPTTYCRDLLPGHREVAATWFLSPERIAAETLIVPSALGVVLLLLIPSLPVSKSTSPDPPSLPIRFLSLICVCIQVFYKISGYANKLAFMVMPCNMLWTVSLLATLIPAARDTLVQCMYSLQILVWVVFVISDTSDLKMPFEIQFFWINHVLLVLVPFYYLFTSKVPAKLCVLDFLKWWLLSCSVTGIFYFGFVTPLAVLTRLNLNYMLSPPPTGGSENFRLESMALMALGFFISRLITVGIYQVVLIAKKKVKQQ
ncbi:hypothetical protein TrCOL_g10045 [Triparma columacea]|uniref:Uncharacterized protein n=1 Tax=Triparma columacea TaxID=722753 RepID=A0A9W7L853_9STRA|nr:hypothetical protein TrCOL_g10045 [Triparma columacea]